MKNQGLIAPDLPGWCMRSHQVGFWPLQTIAIFKRIDSFEEPKKFHFPNVIEKIQ